MPLYQSEKKPMSEADKLRIAAEHATAQLDLESLQEEKRENNSMYRVKINQAKEKVHTLAVQLDEGAFDVQFEVLEEPDDARLMMVIRRKDNGREMGTRPMTEVEKASAQKRKQVDLFDKNDKHDTEPAPPPNGKAKRNGRGKLREPKSVFPKRS